MRHRRATKKLGRHTSSRKALLRGLATNLLVHERILTTREKAKEASILADRLINLGKGNTITSKKNAISLLGSKLLINKLFEDIAPRYINRKGGYTRVLQLMPRKGDGAEMAILELTERKIIEKIPARKKEKLPKEEPGEIKEKKGEEKPHRPVSIASKEEIEAKEEKRKEKAKSEKEKIKKGFLKGLRRYFRGKAT